MMEERPVELDVLSAEELKEVKWTGKMSPYAVAWIYPNHKVTTRACKEGGRNPRWNEKINLMVEERRLHDPSSFLTIEVYHSGTFGPSIIGTAKIPLKEIIKGDKTGEEQYMSYQLRRPSGRAQGVITIGVKLGEKRKVGAQANPSGYGQYQQQQQSGKNQEPVTAYPAGYPPAAAAYPPAGPAYPGAQPYPPQPYPVPQQAYHQYGAYPPQNAYYGAPVAPAPYPPQRHRPSRFGGGGGMGLGLGAGLLGGLLLGEALDNDGGYGGGDYGGGDYGGGDFGGGDFGGDF